MREYRYRFEGNDDIMTICASSDADAVQRADAHALREGHKLVLVYRDGDGRVVFQA